MRAIESLFNISVDHKYVFRPLIDKDLAQMHRTFRESFADYAVPYNLTKDEFTRKMQHKVHISFNHSYGAFSNQKLVAFIFHSVNQYEGSQMAYNAGTGVLPGHRGNHLPAALYEKVLPILSEDGINRCVLEVLETNKRAIHVYEENGFEKTKEFSCFKLNKGIKGRSENCQIESVEGHLDSYIGIGDRRVSFGDTNDQLRYNIQNEVTLEATVEGELVGYLIFQPALGRITQFGVKEGFRRSGIGSALFTQAQNMSTKPLTVININREYVELCTFLESIGFENTLDQLEMQLKIG